MKRIVFLICVFALCFCLVSCDKKNNTNPSTSNSSDPISDSIGNENTNDSTDNSSEQTPDSIENDNNSSTSEQSFREPRCFAKPNENITEKYSSFKDDTYNYYVFYVGRIFNVALEPVSRQYYYGFEDKEISFTVSNASSTSIKEATNEIISNSSHRDYSLSENFKYTKTNNANFGVKIGAFSAGINAGSSIELGLTATQAWGFNNSHTINKSYEICSDTATEREEAFTIKFNKDYPKGNYSYTLMGDLDVYAAVVVDRDAKEFEVYNFSSVVASDETFLYLGENVEYSNEPTEPLKFCLEDVKDCLLIEPTSVIPQSSTIVVTMNRYNCNDGNNYDKNEPESSADWRSRHDGYEIGQLNLYGCQQIGSYYKIIDKNNFAIRYQVLQNVDDLPKVGTTTTFVENDNATGVKGTNISSRVGYGAYWVRITYTDGSQEEPLVDYNILQYASTGTIIDLITTEDINATKNIAKIEIIVVYELRSWWDGWWFFNSKETTNWRCEYTFEFAE